MIPETGTVVEFKDAVLATCCRYPVRGAVYAAVDFDEHWIVVGVGFNAEKIYVKTMDKDRTTYVIDYKQWCHMILEDALRYMPDTIPPHDTRNRYSCGF